MSSQLFDYDVFLSFSSEDEDSVRSIWQQLTLSGLRVFWSDSVLRDRVGASWFDVIQEAVSRSRHLIIAFTPASLASSWVKREYVAFFNHHYSAPNRLLIPVLMPGCRVVDLPLFLREIEAVSVEQPGALMRIVRALGGVDIENLRAELAMREKELMLARQQLDSLKAHEAGVVKELRETSEQLRVRLVVREQELGVARHECESLRARLQAFDSKEAGKSSSGGGGAAQGKRNADPKQETIKPGRAGRPLDQNDPIDRFLSYLSGVLNLPVPSVALLLLVIVVVLVVILGSMH